MRKAKPIESHALPGMEQAIAEQETAAIVQTAEELTKAMLEPLGDVSAKAGRMEEESPLFYGKVNPTLF